MCNKFPLPKNDTLSAQARLEGKLFIGLLIERVVRTAESLSHRGYAMAAPQRSMARGEFMYRQPRATLLVP
jgi:hypothetical protein